MGWFNKKFIYEEKIFGENLLEIYKKAFSRRLKSDYEAILLTNKEEVEESLTEAVFFIKEVKKFIKISYS